MSNAVDLQRVAELQSVEDATFVANHPRSIAMIERARKVMPLGVPNPWMAELWDHPTLYVDHADGSWITDIDGHRYLDVNLGITAGSAGHTPAEVIEATAARMRRGTQFQLPVEDAVVVAEELGRRWGLPKWLFQLSSTQAVTDAIRLARVQTGRERVLVFEGKYQGHLAEILAVEGPDASAEPEYLGVTSHDVSRTTVVPWNDLAAVQEALATQEFAILLAEPALSNSGLVFPADGFHAGLRSATRANGTLLLIDETQTLPMAFGGLVREWALDPDLVVLGKSLGGGVPVAAIGMRDETSALIDRERLAYDTVGEAVDEPAVGGTLFGNALSMSATRAALESVWTQETYTRTSGLAAELASGMREIFIAHARDWDVYSLGNRAGYRFDPRRPVTNADAAEYDIPEVRTLQRVFMANRGVWDFGWWGGPAISAQTTEADVAFYLDRFGEFMDVLLG